LVPTHLISIWVHNQDPHFAKFGSTIGSQNIKPLDPSEESISMVEMN
jgi:hypothetical protein